MVPVRPQWRERLTVCLATNRNCCYKSTLRRRSPLLLSRCFFATRFSGVLDSRYEPRILPLMHFTIFKTTGPQTGTYRARRWVVTVACACVIFSHLVGAVTVRADLRESFESAEPTWRFAEADCRAAITDQQRTFQTSHAGSGSEFVQVTAENGTHVYLTHDIPPAAIISELNVSLWIKADRPGVQLLARVVLPRSLDKQTGKPLTMFVRGTLYEQVGAWQQLRIDSVAALLAPAVRVKRSELHQNIDEKQAYIDKIVLNAYGGARITNIYIDELEVAGLVTPALIGKMAKKLCLVPSHK